MKNTKLSIIFKLTLYILAFPMILHSFWHFNSSWNEIGIVAISLLACIVMNQLSINISRGNVDFTDAIAAFIFLKYGSEMTIAFITIQFIIIIIISAKHKFKYKEPAAILFNSAMVIADTFITAMIFKGIRPMINDSSCIEMSLLVTGYTVVFLLINIILFVAYDCFSNGEFRSIPTKMWKLVFINGLISIVTATTLYLVTSMYGVIGEVLVIIILIFISYCLSINRKLEIKNDIIRDIIKITRDIVIYGDFGDKCKYLITALNDLIPYSMCSIFSFKYENDEHANDEVCYPIAARRNEGMDISELAITLPLAGHIQKKIEKGSIYTTSNPTVDLKGQIPMETLNKIQTAIIVPIMVNNKIAGLICIGGDKKLIRFTSYGIDDMLNILSNQIALAMENNTVYNTMRDSADVDALTRLYNRRVFKREINELIASKTRFSMVIYDIDDFKQINDTYGHLAGDEILKIISEDIRKSIRKTDIPCRYGGEEIVIIFKDLDKEDALVISERIRKRIECDELNWDGKCVKATVSGGIAAYPCDGNCIEDIVGKADNALYTECKQKGKNKVHAYNI